jgi:DNA-binding NtrC family response regulator
VARVELPPLRDRAGDVALLARHFWTDLGGAPPAPPPEVLARFETYAWPGNVRELRNEIARQIALGDLADAGPFEPGSGAGEAPPAEASAAGAHWADAILALDIPLPRARQLVVDEFQRRYVARVLDRHGGNVSRAAASSGIARRYFQIIRARQR